MIDSKLIFKTIAHGIKFYEKFFSHPFPFHKYDQVFVPEFRIGAMENVGLIIMTDNVLKSKDEMS